MDYIVTTNGDLKADAIDLTNARDIARLYAERGLTATITGTEYREIISPELLREQYVYEAALTCDLDYSEVKTSGEAEWATNGYKERLKNLINKYRRLGYLSEAQLSEAQFINDFLNNLDCDFGE